MAPSPGALVKISIRSCHRSNRTNNYLTIRRCCNKRAPSGYAYSNGGCVPRWCDDVHSRASIRLSRMHASGQRRPHFPAVLSSFSRQTACVSRSNEGGKKTRNPRQWRFASHQNTDVKHRKSAFHAKRKPRGKSNAARMKHRQRRRRRFTSVATLEALIDSPLSQTYLLFSPPFFLSNTFEYARDEQPQRAHFPE